MIEGLLIMLCPVWVLSVFLSETFNTFIVCFQFMKVLMFGFAHLVVLSSTPFVLLLVPKTDSYSQNAKIIVHFLYCIPPIHFNFGQASKC